MTNAVNIAQSGSNNVTFRNRIINGAMVIDQRNAGASVTPSTGTYTLDRWRAYSTNGTAFTVQQSSTVPAGFQSSLKVTSTAATSVASGDYYFLMQRIEAYNVADFGLGAVGAKAFTVSFWVYSSLTGTFGGSLLNNNQDYSYPFQYTISSANTWTQIALTFAGPTAGTWATGNSTGLTVLFDLGGGASNLGTAGSWQATGYYGATGDTKVVATNGATWYVTGVQLEAGTTASPFEYRQYGTEFYLCQRYYAKLGANASGSSSYQAYGAGHMNSANTQSEFHLPFPQFMRATPTIAFSGSIGISANGSYINVTNIASAYTGVSSALVQIASGAIGSAGQGALLLSNADATAYISLTSEL